MVKLTTGGKVNYKKNTKVISSFIENAESSGMVNFRNAQTIYKSREQNPDFEDEDSCDEEMANETDMGSLRRKSIIMMERLGSGMKEGLGDIGDKLGEMVDESPLKRMRSNSETEEVFNEAQSVKRNRFSKWNNYSKVFDNLTREVKI